MNDFKNYIESLARRHKEINHSDDSCHFSCLQEDMQNKLSRTIHYPVVVIDGGDMAFTGEPENILSSTQYAIMFLDHVRDNGDTTEINTVISHMKDIMLSFMRQIYTDRKSGRYPFLRRFLLNGSEAERIYNKDSSLYGYVLFVSNYEKFFECPDDDFREE